MQFRRAVAMLSGLCVLSLTIGRSESSCEQTKGVAAAASMDDHGGMHAQSQGAEQQHKPCKSSTVVCCDAMTSCGLAVQLTPVSEQAVQTAESPVPSAPLQVALYRTTPPELPPPKA